MGMLEKVSAMWKWLTAQGTRRAEQRQTRLALEGLECRVVLSVSSPPVPPAPLAVTAPTRPPLGQVARVMPLAAAPPNYFGNDLVAGATSWNAPSRMKGFMITPDQLTNVPGEYAQGPFDTLTNWKANILRVELVGSGQADHAYKDWLEGEISKIKAALPALAARGIGIVISMQDPPGEGGGNEGKPHGMLRGDAQAGPLKQQFLEAWSRIAQAFQNERVVVGYDLLNEPAFDLGTRNKPSAEEFQRWNKLARETHDLIRGTGPGSLNATRTIVIESVAANPDWLPKLDPAYYTARGSNVVFSFHMYDKMEFTHFDVPNVISHENIQDLREEFTDRIKRHAQQVLDDVRKWQQQYKVRVFVGEFSASFQPNSVKLAELETLKQQKKEAEGRSDQAEAQKLGLKIQDLEARLYKDEGKRKESIADYLRWCTAQFARYHWDWTYHAFREAECWNLEHTFGPLDPNDGDSRPETLWARSDLLRRLANNPMVFKLTPGHQSLPLSTGLVSVQGTGRADTIIIRDATNAPGTYEVLVNGEVDEVGLWSDVRSLTVSGLGGNDHIDIISSAYVNYPVSIRLEGGDGDDVLDGEAGNDTLVGGAGHDILYGRAGNDRLEGWAGDDQLHGMEGDDLVWGGDGNDNIGGGQGNDRLFGEAGNDVIWCGDGDDFASGGDGNDGIAGEGGKDTIEANAGNDQATGGDGDDALYGGDGDDVLYGFAGNDLLDGGAGDDGMTGDEGDDTLFGRDGRDNLYGRAGLDAIYGGSGDDVLDGGDGADQLFGEDGNDVLDGGAGDDLMVGAAGNDILYGRAGNDTLAGNAGDDQLHGMEGDDVAWGGEGNDNFGGGQGNDRLFGEAGNDVIWCGDGNDLADGGDGNDGIAGEGGNDQVFAGAGNDQLTGGDGDDALYGGDGDDNIWGFAGNDYIEGGRGNDGMTGDEGNDRIVEYAGQGVDGIMGRDGDDQLTGERGVDTIDGGAGNNAIFTAQAPPSALVPPAAARQADFNGDGIADLVFIKKAGTGTNSTEVHVLDGATGYRTFLVQTGTALHMTGAEWELQALDFNHDGRVDLAGIKKSGTGSGKVEVHVLNGADNFRSWLTQTPTAFAPVGANGQFSLEDVNRDGVYDLVLILKSGTGTRTTEVHAFDGRNFGDGFFRRAIVQTGTALHETGAEGELKLADYNGDGVLDLWYIKKYATGTGSVEVHVFSGADNFRTALLHTGTPLPEARGDVEFELSDLDRDGKLDLYFIEKRGAAGPAVVRVLLGAGNFQTTTLYVGAGLLAGPEGTFSA